MIKLGKYYGEDLNASIYEVSEILSDFYADISSVENFMTIGQSEVGLTEQVATNYSIDYINSTGISNLSERDYNYAVYVGLI